MTSLTAKHLTARATGRRDEIAELRAQVEVLAEKAGVDMAEVRAEAAAAARPEKPAPRR